MINSKLLIMVNHKKGDEGREKQVQGEKSFNLVLYRISVNSEHVLFFFVMSHAPPFIFEHVLFLKFFKCVLSKFPPPKCHIYTSKISKIPLISVEPCHFFQRLGDR